MFRKTFCGLAIAACLAAAPAFADEDGDKLNANITEYDMPNGMHVILMEDHTVPMVSTNLWYLVGSADEEKGRHGFAHLFEHLMFCGSAHVPRGEFDNLLERVGGENNASTNEDRTNYYITVPSNALPLALYLESDRMGFLLDKMPKNIVDEQRDVVKNEMRQRYYNTPYHRAFIEIPTLMYPEGHPYSWPVIGTVEDLDKADYQTVVDFHKHHYAPNNASLAIVGDINIDETKKMVNYWFGDLPRGKFSTWATYGDPPELKGVVKKTITDSVQIPRRMLLWHSPPEFVGDDAALDVVSSILTGTKNSRLYKRLVYEGQIAQTVEATQMSQDLCSLYCVDFMPRPGHNLDEIQKVIDEEIERLANNPPEQWELDMAINNLTYQYFRLIEKNDNVANYLNRYYGSIGRTNWFKADLERYTSLTPEAISQAVRRYLRPEARAELTIVPEDSKSTSVKPLPGDEVKEKEPSAASEVAAKTTESAPAPVAADKEKEAQ